MSVKLHRLSWLHVLGVRQTQSLTGGARIEAFKAQQERGTLMHQTHAPAQQIAHRPQFRIVNVGFGKNLQALQLRQIIGVVFVVGVLEAVVLLNFGGIGQINRIT